MSNLFACRGNTAVKAHEEARRVVAGGRTNVYEAAVRLLCDCRRCTPENYSELRGSMQGLPSQKDPHHLDGV